MSNLFLPRSLGAGGSFCHNTFPSSLTDIPNCPRPQSAWNFVVSNDILGAKVDCIENAKPFDIFTFMGIPDTDKTIRVDEYLQGELKSEIRHEYIGGQVYAMSGGSEEHNAISLNLASALRQHLRGNPCRVFIADMKLRLTIAEDDIFYYPDILVTCDPSDDAKYYKCKPSVLVEVLSPSTERLDRREKFLSYQQLPSLQEYVLIAQDQLRVTLFRRSRDWKPEILTKGQTLELPSLQFQQALSDLYEDVLTV